MRVLFLQWLSPVDPLKQDCGESTEKMLEALLAVTVRQKTPQYFYIDRWNPWICDFYLGFHALLCFGWVNTFCQKHCSNSTYIAPGVRPCFRVCVCVEAWFRLWRQTESAELWPLEPSLITALVQVGRHVPWSRRSLPLIVPRDVRHWFMALPSWLCEGNDKTAASIGSWETLKVICAERDKVPSIVTGEGSSYTM